MKYSGMQVISNAVVADVGTSNPFKRIFQARVEPNNQYLYAVGLVNLAGVDNAGVYRMNMSSGVWQQIYVTPGTLSTVGTLENVIRTLTIAPVASSLGNYRVTFREYKDAVEGNAAGVLGITREVIAGSPLTVQDVNPQRVEDYISSSYITAGGYCRGLTLGNHFYTSESALYEWNGVSYNQILFPPYTSLGSYNVALPAIGQHVYVQLYYDDGVNPANDRIYQLNLTTRVWQLVTIMNTAHTPLFLGAAASDNSDVIYLHALQNLYKWVISTNTCTAIATMDEIFSIINTGTSTPPYTSLLVVGRNGLNTGVYRLDNSNALSLQLVVGYTPESQCYTACKKTASYEMPSVSPPAYDAATTALLTQMLIGPTDARATLINNTILSLKSAGLWAKLDLLQVYCSHNEQAALINWKQPTIVGVGVPGSGAFVPDVGFTATTAIDTNFIPSVNGSAMTTNNESYVVMLSNSNITGIGYAMRTGNTQPRASLFLDTSAPEVRYEVSNSALIDDSASYSSFDGMWILQRTNSTNVELYRNNSLVSSASRTSYGGLSSDTIVVGTAPAHPGYLSPFDSTKIMCAAGSQLNNTERAALKTIIDGFIAGL